MKSYINLLILCFSFNSFAQETEKANQQYQTFQDKVITYSFNNNDSLIYYARKMQSSDDLCFNYKGILYEARGLYQQEKLEQSKALVLTAIDRIEKEYNLSCKNERLIDAYRRLFYISRKENKYEEALSYVLIRKGIVDNLNIKNDYYYKNLIDVEGCLGYIKIKLGENEEALAILKNLNNNLSSLNIDELSAESMNNYYLQRANILNSIGDAYISLFERNKNKILLDSAYNYYDKSYSYITENNRNNKDSEAVFKIREIKILIKKGEYKQALNYQTENENLFKSFPNYRSDVNLNKALLYKHLKTYDSAVYFSKKYLDYYKSLHIENEKHIEVYNNLSESYSALKQYDSALKYSNLSLQKYQEDALTKNNTQKDLYDLEIQRTEDEIEELSNKIFNNKIYWSIGVLFLVLGFGTFMYINNKKKKKKKKQRNGNTFSDKVTNTVLNGLIDFEKTELYLDNEFNIKSLADYLDTNTTYLSSIINTHKNKTFKDYLAELRINTAISKMEKDSTFLKYTIETMGKEVGYSNPSSFTRAFKRVKNITPSEYIQKHFK